MWRFIGFIESVSPKRGVQDYHLSASGQCRGLELSPQEFFFEHIAVGRHGHSADIRVS